MNAELPAISASSYTSTPLNMVAIANQFGQARGLNANALDQAVFDQFLRQQPVPTPVKPKEQKPMSTTRLVQVFIADTNDNIPLDKRLLYSGEQKLTDLTDQELFFEVDIKTMLDKHNEVRKATVDKAVKERTEYLEPARIRDLKMTVVTIAQF
jgi:hypothetical protein